jgi:hypothetical protein
MCPAAREQPPCKKTLPLVWKLNSVGNLRWHVVRRGK